MNKRLGRYCNRVIALGCAFVVFFAGFYLTSFQSNATVQNVGQEFYVHYPRPAMTDNQGYINLLFQRPNGTYYLNTIFWNLFTFDKDGVPIYANSMITLNDDSWVYGGSGFPNLIGGFHYNLYMINADGHFWFLKNSTEVGHTHTTSGTIVGYQAFGNVQVVDNLSKSNTVFTVYYSDDGASQLLFEVIRLLYENSADNSLIFDEVHKILNSVDNVESQLSDVIDYLRSIDSELNSIKSELQDIYDKADEILQEEKKQTSWLEKIYNKIVEALGLKGEESTEKLPDEEVGSVLEDEDNLMQDTTEAENSLDFSVDSNSNNVVWNVIERVLNANPRVFGAFIGIMTLGVITLLLNR